MFADDVVKIRALKDVKWEELVKKRTQHMQQRPLQSEGFFQYTIRCECGCSRDEGNLVRLVDNYMTTPSYSPKFNRYLASIVRTGNISIAMAYNLITLTIHMHAIGAFLKLEKKQS